MTIKTHFQEKELLCFGFTKAMRKSDGKMVILNMNTDCRRKNPGVYEVDYESDSTGKYWHFIGRENIGKFDFDEAK